MQAIDESTLILNLKKGDQGSFEVLVKMYYRAAYNFAFRYMQEHSGADDVVQDSFFKAYKAIQNFRGDSSFKSWLLRIVRNTALNVIRSRKNKESVDLEDLALGEQNKGYFTMEHVQTREFLARAIAELPAKQKMALELRIFEDMSFKEIAEIMESPFDTAKANFRHALLNLRKILKKTDDGNALREARYALRGLAEEES